MKGRSGIDMVKGHRDLVKGRHDLVKVIILLECSPATVSHWSWSNQLSNDVVKGHQLANHSSFIVSNWTACSEPPEFWKNPMLQLIPIRV